MKKLTIPILVMTALLLLLILPVLPVLSSAKTKSWNTMTTPEINEQIELRKIMIAKIDQQLKDRQGFFGSLTEDDPAVTFRSFPNRDGDIANLLNEKNFYLSNIQDLESILYERKLAYENRKKALQDAPHNQQHGQTQNAASSRSNPPPPASGWHRNGPTIKTSPLPKDNNCYFGYGIKMSNGGATGTQSWKEAGCTKNKGGCSGTYTGEVTWTVPPAFLKPGSAIPFKVTAKTVAKNTCGSLNIGSWVAMKSGGPQAFVTVSDAAAPGKLMEAKTTWTVPKGQPNQNLIFEVGIQAANLSGRATYTYVYK
jgi:hypothetical protein